MSTRKQGSRALGLALSTGAALVAAVGFAMITTGVAQAHVTTSPATAAKGSYATITFRVPDESKTAGTVKLQVTLPTDHPIASVRTEPVPGWTAQIASVTLNPPVTEGHTTISEAPHVITWTAQPGVRLSPTEFGQFNVSMGALPTDVDELRFPAVQTYDDGHVVSWDQVQTPGAEEPEHPAPSVKLVDGAGATNLDAASHGHSTTAGLSDGSPADGTDNTARWLGGLGLLLGALGLGLGAGALARTRRSGSSSGGGGA